MQGLTRLAAVLSGTASYGAPLRLCQGAPVAVVPSAAGGYNGSSRGGQRRCRGDTVRQRQCRPGGVRGPGAVLQVSILGTVSEFCRRTRCALQPQSVCPSCCMLNGRRLLRCSEFGWCGTEAKHCSYGCRGGSCWTLHQSVAHLAGKDAAGVHNEGPRRRLLQSR